MKLSHRTTNPENLVKISPVNSQITRPEFKSLKKKQIKTLAEHVAQGRHAARGKLCVYMVPFSSYNELFVVVADFSLPHLHSASPFGMT